VTAQEMRKNLSDESYTQIIDKWINEIRKDFVKYDQRMVMETVGPNGEFIDHFDGRTLNPGHALEGAWFIMEEARVRDNDEGINKPWNYHARLYVGNRMDKEYGGITYFKDAKGLPVQEYWHDMKFWSATERSFNSNASGLVSYG